MGLVGGGIGGTVGKTLGYTAPEIGAALGETVGAQGINVGIGALEALHHKPIGDIISETF